MEIDIKKAGYIANQSSIEQIEFLIYPGKIIGPHIFFYKFKRCPKFYSKRN